jgi:apolipoprotein N-acyltransferase
LVASITMMSGRPREGRWDIGPAGRQHKENDVRSLVRFLIMVFLSMGVWIAIGLGVGFLLHWLVPAIDLGMGTLIGVVTLGGCFLWLSRLSTLEALYGADDMEWSEAPWSTTPEVELRSARRKRRRRRP